MKKCFYLLLLITSFCFSQQNGQVDYDFSFVKLQYNSKDIEQANANKTVDLIAKFATKHKYTLKYNKNESIYNVRVSMPMDGINDFSYKFSKYIFSKGVFYQNNLTNEIINEMSSMNQNFLIKDIISNDWELSSETKYIGKFKCYKATSICNTCTNNQIVTIWYTPEIPVSFGPAGYGGAPGLILEVSKYRYTLRANKIKFFKHKVNIIKPKKGKIISKKELKELQREARSSMMSGKRKS